MRSFLIKNKGSHFGFQAYIHTKTRLTKHVTSSWWIGSLSRAYGGIFIEQTARVLSQRTGLPDLPLPCLQLHHVPRIRKWHPWQTLETKKPAILLGKNKQIKQNQHKTKQITQTQTNHTTYLHCCCCCLLQMLKYTHMWVHLDPTHGLEINFYWVLDPLLQLKDMPLLSPITSETWCIVLLHQLKHSPKANTFHPIPWSDFNPQHMLTKPTW